MPDTPAETAEHPFADPTIPAAVPVLPVPNDPPWNSWIAVGTWVVSVLLILVVPAIFLAPYAVSQSSNYADTADLVKAIATDPTAIAIQIAAIVPAHILTLLIAWLVVTKVRTFSFKRTLGWSTGGIRWWHYVVIVGIFFLFALILGSFLPEQENELTRILKSSQYIVFLVAFMATFTAPLVEEVIYRGLLFSAFQRSIGTTSAVGLVTFLFALVHVPQYWESISTMILLFLLSLTLTAMRAYTKNLLPCVILHTVFNGSQSLLLIIQKFVDPQQVGGEAVPGLFHLLK